MYIDIIIILIQSIYNYIALGKAHNQGASENETTCWMTGVLVLFAI